MTGLIPWRRKPKNNIVPLERTFDSIYDRFLREPMLSLSGLYSGSNRWWPGIDIQEKDEAIKVTAELPGLEKEDIEVSLKGRFLTIKGEKTTENKKERKNFFNRECSYGYFERTIQLPDEVADTSIKAKYKRGVLTLNMKKTGRHSGKTIPIKTGKKKQTATL